LHARGVIAHHYPSLITPHLPLLPLTLADAPAIEAIFP
jgi:hypothetical protein